MLYKRSALSCAARKVTTCALTATMALAMSPVAFAGTASAVESNGSSVVIDASTIDLTEKNASGIQYLSVSSVIDQISDQAQNLDAPAMEDVAIKVIKQAKAQKEAVAEEALSVAKSLKGTPYLYGGSTPAGFDCSGFTMYCYKKAGVKLTHNAQAQFNETKSVKTKNMKAGDLVFFGGSTGSITHVGIYVGNGKYIHSPQSGEYVRIDSLDDRCNFVGATRPTA